MNDSVKASLKMSLINDVLCFLTTTLQQLISEPFRSLLQHFKWFLAYSTCNYYYMRGNKRLCINVLSREIMNILMNEWGRALN